MEKKTEKRPSRSATSHTKSGREHRKGSDKLRKGNKMLENPSNPWAYSVKLPLLNEADKCDLADLDVLNCRSNYCIRTVSQGYTEKGRDDELFRIYGNLVNQSANFMRQWIRCFALTRKKYVMNLACEYLNKKVQNWVLGYWESSKGNMLMCWLHSCLMWSQVSIVLFI